MNHYHRLIKPNGERYCIVYTDQTRSRMLKVLYGYMSDPALSFNVDDWMSLAYRMLGEQWIAHFKEGLNRDASEQTQGQ